MSNRYLIDFDNPDAGIGHSMGIINRAVKIAARNQLQFAYSQDQLAKSHSQSFQWKFKQFLRRLRGKNAYESHNIGNDLNLMLNLEELLPSRKELEKKIKQRQMKVVKLPRIQVDIPSNDQNDDDIYREVDELIQGHPEANTIFKIYPNPSGDYEYASTRQWFIDAYIKARATYPIALSFDPSAVNIAVHIRRGDLLPGRQFSDLSSRMLPDSWYLEILSIATEHIKGRVAIHIFSEGKNGQYHSEDGQAFSWKAHFKNSPYEIHEHIDSDFMSTFHHLLHADLLIGSKSGMSHLAGMLSSQVKIMPRMWHSYRGTNQLIEVAGTKSELNREAIAKHLQTYLS